VRAVIRAALAGACLLVACGGGDDPCAGVAGTCVAIHVSSDVVAEVDQLELDIVYGERHATTSTQADGGRVVALPLDTAITIAADDEVTVAIVAAGKRSGVVLGTGAGSVTVAAGARGAIVIELAEPDACIAGGFYCGGDRVAGDPDTLYACNAGGVPIARGVCAHGCATNPADDDACRGGPETCFDGGFYCGGNEVDGDPRTLYTCANGAGTAGVECADECRVAAAGSDDECR